MSVIECNSISHSFRDELVLDQISCLIPEGKIVALLGPSGCGKTTFLRICAGLLTPSSGYVKINGQSPSEAKKKGLIGFAFQQPTLLPWRTALENLFLPFELGKRKITPQEKQQALALLEQFGLKSKANVYPRDLSGGMQQRVGLARALISSPSILFLDEPFGQLDPKNRDKLNEHVRVIIQKNKQTMVFVTHSVEEATLVADQVIVFSRQPATIANTVLINLEEFRSNRTKMSAVYAKLVHEIENSFERA